MQRRFPCGFELVYDNYNALVFGISPNGSTNEAFVSVAGYPRWVTLFFLHGTNLQEPQGVLEGHGKQVRSIRIASAADIHLPEVRARIGQAALPFKARLLAASLRYGHRAGGSGAAITPSILLIRRCRASGCSIPLIR